MAMSRRANKSANSKRKVSRKGSKRVSRKGKKGSRKGTKKRGMLAKLMGKMRRGKRSNRKSKGKKVAVLVPAKGGQRGGAYPALITTLPNQGVFGTNIVVKAVRAEDNTWATKADLRNATPDTIKINNVDHLVSYVSKADFEQAGNVDMSKLKKLENDDDVTAWADATDISA
jgi:hypothetical protein